MGASPTWGPQIAKSGKNELKIPKITLLLTKNPRDPESSSALPDPGMSRDPSRQVIGKSQIPYFLRDNFGTELYVFVKVYTLARLRNRTSLLYRDFAFPTYLFRSLFVIVSRERERAKELECKSCVTCFLSHRLSIARIMA